jgi:tRNA (guanine10-N2)-dimethyltransferase
MKYFFILGNNPTLSTAEISAVFGLSAKETKFPMGSLVSENVLILETKEKINAAQLIKRLGGAIKIGEIKAETDNNREKILNKAKELLKPGNGKFKFGISYYGKNKFNIKPLGMEIKKYLREQGISCRWVTSREPTLSSVVVEQNKLAGKGIEIILISSHLLSRRGLPAKWEGVGGEVLIGKTLAVQPFKELSFRDYGRPARDDRSGMLPPKLAQIMINLSQAKPSELIIDPFCGSGTILTEAMLMGYKDIIGSDKSEKATSNTRKNITWINSKFQVPNSKFQIHDKSALELSTIVKPSSVDAIVTEPYLGPQRGKINIKKVKKELEELYSKSLAEFKRILKPNGKIVIIFPVFRETNHINPNLNGFKIINPIPGTLQNNTHIKLTNRNTIVYGRPGQKVWREIVVLKK